MSSWSDRRGPMGLLGEIFRRRTVYRTLRLGKKRPYSQGGNSMNPRLISRLFFSMSVFSLLFSCADPRTGECSADTDCPDGERCVLQACILDDTQPIDDTDTSSEVSDASDEQ